MAASSGDEELVDKGEQALKVVLLGDSDTGKTAICCRLAQHTFPERYTRTAGVDFYSRRVNLPQNCSVLLQLWDVGGHNLASPSMLNTYIFGAQAVLFVYDVTNSQTFENLTDWMQIVKKRMGQLEKPFYLGLVGNKADNEHRRAIRVEKHSKFAEQHAMQSHFYVSAKTGDSIELVFKKVAAEILGIQFSKAEQEWNINVVQAQIQAADRHTGGKKAAQEEPKQKLQKDKDGEDKGMLSKAMEPPPSIEAEAKAKNSAACRIQ